MVVGHGELQLRRASDGGGNDNADTPEIGQLRGDDDMIEELKAELWARWSKARRGGEHARARWSYRRQWRSAMGKTKCGLYLDSLAQRQGG